jgi:hypothetical protein
MRKFRSWHLVCFALAGVAAAVWAYQAWVIRGYQAEFRASLGDRHDLPDDHDLGFLARMVDTRVATAETVQHWALLAAVVALIGGVVLVARPGQQLFVVRINGGTAKVVEGKLTAAFVEELAECCREAGVPDGEVVGQGTPWGVRLSFSASFPPGVRQRLRNLWVQHLHRVGRSRA